MVSARRMDGLWTARTALRIPGLLVNHPFNLRNCILCNENIADVRTFAHLVIDCDSLAHIRDDAELGPFIVLARQCLGTQAALEDIYTWLLGGATPAGLRLNDWLLATPSDTPPPTSVLYNAVCSGNADVLEAVLAAAPKDELSSFEIAYALRCCNVGFALRMFDVLKPMPDFRPSEAAAMCISCGNADVLRTVVALGTLEDDCVDEAVVQAAGAGFLEVIKVVHAATGSAPWRPAAFVAAIKGGWIDVALWLEGLSDDAAAADEQRSVTMLDVLLQAPAELRVPEVMDAVAEAGNLALLAQLHARGFSGTSEIMLLAARSGHLDVVGFLHAHGFPCTIDCLESSVSYHRTDVARFLFEHCDGIVFANALKDIHIVFWETIVDEIHTDVDLAACECGLLSRAIKGAGAKLVSLLLAHGHTVNNDAARIAGEGGNIKIAQILGPHLSPAQWQVMHDGAQQSKRKQLLAWIESSKPSAGTGRKRPAGSDATASRPARRKSGGRSK
ncbi:hypothetical protein HK105_208420 [Polyrhizophydium stewartii]|uniref:Ankyrin repeat protein n=1 Tax=Polyrhizophydium stewartii TaxID=2732419 RepID=A0ABR4MXS8_9FUNG